MHHADVIVSIRILPISFMILYIYSLRARHLAIAVLSSVLSARGHMGTTLMHTDTESAPQVRYDVGIGMSIVPDTRSISSASTPAICRARWWSRVLYTMVACVRLVACSVCVQQHMASSSAVPGFVFIFMYIVGYLAVYRTAWEVEGIYGISQVVERAEVVATEVVSAIESMADDGNAVLGATAGRAADDAIDALAGTVGDSEYMVLCHGSNAGHYGP